jgi:hypothetical protein
MMSRKRVSETVNRWVLCVHPCISKDAACAHTARTAHIGFAFLKLFFSDALHRTHCPRLPDPEVRWVRITVVPQSICGSHAASSIKLQPYANITSEEGNEQ